MVFELVSYLIKIRQESRCDRDRTMVTLALTLPILCRPILCFVKYNSQVLDGSQVDFR